MRARARRLPARGWRRFVRRARLALCLVAGGQAVAAEPVIIAASYAGPTTRYAHAVLGDATEHTTLVLRYADGTERRFSLPDDLVFEDIAPRLVDLDFDGAAEVIAVESSQTKGARLAVYGADGRITSTPHIGTRFRWLAPVGAADLDGDGVMEIAYVDRPHLAKTLRLWRYENGRLSELAALPGVTNHRIGEADIAGGIRTCAGVAEMIVASANWSRLVSVSYMDGAFTTKTLGSDTSRPGFARAMACAP
ncbi:VCBS repeat-containing protein [Roseobacter sp.]|uniref:FG-GAP repeat domain-containing protein n=1 Tax=Roseobacter sp. TaxID=1907202 RepID=UPI002965D5C4|nr:VCBS repeat-containing protein [Roseobacter sp.]MDW3182249.1 VCBS repeat-containing protein [Roseobacter sp.]